MAKVKQRGLEFVEEPVAPATHTASLVLSSSSDSSGVISTNLSYHPQIDVHNWGDVQELPAAYKVMVELVMYMHNLLGTADYGNRITQFPTSNKQQ